MDLFKIEASPRKTQRNLHLIKRIIFQVPCFRVTETGSLRPTPKDMDFANVVRFAFAQSTWARVIDWQAQVGVERFMTCQDEFLYVISSFLFECRNFQA